MEKINLNTTNSKWIMDCSTIDAIDLCYRYMLTIEDLQQLCGDKQPAGELESAYNFFEQVVRNMKPSDTISTEKRNEIRLTCKHILKIGVVMGFDFNSNYLQKVGEE